MDIGLDMVKEAIDLGLSGRLSRFFQQAGSPLRWEAEEKAPELQIDRERFVRFIEGLPMSLNNAEAQACANPWGAAGLGYDEVRISAVLAALWDRRQYGDEARAFLSRFFARAGHGFPNEAELADGYRVQTEHCLNGSLADRVDITVETRWSLIGIELKIYAGEGENQLSRYVTAIETRARLMQRSNHNVIFLSPYAPKSDVGRVATVNWRTVGEIAAEADRSTYAGWLIGQFGEYCRGLGN